METCQDCKANEAGEYREELSGIYAEDVYLCDGCADERYDSINTQASMERELGLDWPDMGA